MVEINIAQAEADALLAMAKIRTTDDEYEYPGTGIELTIPLTSQDHRENFTLDIWQSGNIQLKGRYQNRAGHIIILARLDFGGQPHRNPDDAELACPHLHLYREGYGDKWAFELPADFKKPSDPWQTLNDFMAYCNITKRPIITRGLFI